jgi:hypothetical protein
MLTILVRTLAWLQESNLALVSYTNDEVTVQFPAT